MNRHPATPPSMHLRYSPVNQAWVSYFGDALNSIGADRRTIFATVQDFNDYCRTTNTPLRALANGGDRFAPIVTTATNS